MRISRPTTSETKISPEVERGSEKDEFIAKVENQNKELRRRIQSMAVKLDEMKDIDRDSESVGESGLEDKLRLLMFELKKEKDLVVKISDENKDLNLQISALKKRVIREIERASVASKVTNTKIPISLQANINLRNQYKTKLDIEREKYLGIEEQNKNLVAKIKTLEKTLAKKGISAEARYQRTNAITFWQKKHRASELEILSVQRLLHTQSVQLEKETKANERLQREINEMREQLTHLPSQFGLYSINEDIEDIDAELRKLVQTRHQRKNQRTKTASSIKSVSNNKISKFTSTSNIWNGNERLSRSSTRDSRNIQQRNKSQELNELEFSNGSIYDNEVSANFQDENNTNDSNFELNTLERDCEIDKENDMEVEVELQKSKKFIQTSPLKNLRPLSKVNSQRAQESSISSKVESKKSNPSSSKTIRGIARVSSVEALDSNEFIVHIEPRDTRTPERDGMAITYDDEEYTSDFLFGEPESIHRIKPKSFHDSQSDIITNQQSVVSLGRSESNILESQKIKILNEDKSKLKNRATETISKENTTENPFKKSPLLTEKVTSKTQDINKSNKDENIKRPKTNSTEQISQEKQKESPNKRSSLPNDQSDTSKYKTNKNYISKRHHAKNQINSRFNQDNPENTNIDDEENDKLQPLPPSESSKIPIRGADRINPALSFNSELGFVDEVFRESSISMLPSDSATIAANLEKALIANEEMKRALEFEAASKAAELTEAKKSNSSLKQSINSNLKESTHSISQKKKNHGSLESVKNFTKSRPFEEFNGSKEKSLPRSLNHAIEEPPETSENDLNLSNYESNLSKEKLRIAKVHLEYETWVKDKDKPE
ncbi:hypothetical protein HK096_004113 [Nowakowskiella sp. JEL0078]|nr:hypothetical protein HK096_004113 [Nowakowskiella sp. JEL0078]